MRRDRGPGGLPGAAERHHGAAGDLAGLPPALGAGPRRGLQRPSEDWGGGGGRGHCATDLLRKRNGACAPGLGSACVIPRAFPRRKLVFGLGGGICMLA